MKVFFLVLNLYIFFLEPSFLTAQDCREEKTSDSVMEVLGSSSNKRYNIEISQPITVPASKLKNAYKLIYSNGNTYSEDELDKMNKNDRNVILKNYCVVTFFAYWLEAMDKDGKHQDRTFQGSLLIDNIVADNVDLRASRSQTGASVEFYSNMKTTKVFSVDNSAVPLKQSAISNFDCHKETHVENPKTEDAVSADILVGDIQRNFGGPNGKDFIKVFLNTCSSNGGKKSSKGKKFKVTPNKKNHSLPR